MASKTTSTKGNAAGLSLPASMQSNVLMILGVGLVLGFVVGHLWTKVNMLEAGTTAQAGAPAAAGQDVAGATTELKIAKPDPKKDHWWGPEDAQYVHVEYSDFECPFCGAYAPTVDQLKEEYGDKMAFVYRHFPLAFHPLAQPAAEASECVADAGGNDAFWKFHDLIFAKMPNVTVDGLAGIAAEAGVNATTFQTCYDAGTFKDKVQEQFNEGTTAGVGATPTSVIYNMKTGETAPIEGALPFDQVKTIVDGMVR